MMKTETISACMQASFADTPFPVVVDAGRRTTPT